MNLTKKQIQILKVIRDNQPISHKGIRNVVSPHYRGIQAMSALGSISRVVYKLRDLKLIEECPTGESQRFQLTEKGKENIK